MTNPYQPPQQSSEQGLKQLLSRSTYLGGKLAVTLLAVISGTISAILVYVTLDLSTPVPAFASPAIVWIGTLIALMSMLRGAQVAAATKIWLSLLIAIPAYIVYVPVCTFGAMFTTEFLGSRGYGPTASGLVLASVVAFVVILLVVAAIVRRCLKHPIISEDPTIVSTNQHSFDTPFDEQPHE